MIVHPWLIAMTPLVRSRASAVSDLKGMELSVRMLMNAPKKAAVDGMPPAPTLSGHITAIVAKVFLEMTQRAAPLAHRGAIKVPLALSIALSASLVSTAYFPLPQMIHFV